MITGVHGAAASSGSDYTPQASSTPPAAPPATENMFLQLLVAQLKNQDPTSPADSTQFISQLAQFQTMEQSLHQSQDIAAIRTDLDQLVTTQGAITSS